MTRNWNSHIDLFDLFLVAVSHVLRKDVRYERDAMWITVYIGGDKIKGRGYVSTARAVWKHVKEKGNSEETETYGKMS